MDSITEIQTLIKELLAKENYTLYSFKYSEGKKSGSMEIVVDREEDINIDDITDISNKISNLLDLHEFNNVPYTLDIFSLNFHEFLLQLFFLFSIMIILSLLTIVDNLWAIIRIVYLFFKL